MDRQSLGGTLFDALLLDHAHDEHDLKRHESDTGSTTFIHSPPAPRGGSSGPPSSRALPKPTARCGSKGSAAESVRPIPSRGRSRCEPKGHSSRTRIILQSARRVLKILSEPEPDRVSIRSWNHPFFESESFRLKAFATHREGGCQLRRAKIKLDSGSWRVPRV
jgi:hypothetical protein